MNIYSSFYKFVGFSAIFGFLSMPASAVSINIENHSFESPVVVVSEQISPTGWSRSGGTDAGVFRPSGFPASGPGFISGVDGSQTAFSNGPDFSQTLTDTLQVGTYDLTVAIGNRVDFSLPSYTINLLAGGTTIATGGNAAVPNDGWIDLTVSITITAANALLGSILGIELVNNGGIQMNWDNVRLELNDSVTVVPVPPALPLFGTGLALMGFLSWRRKRKLS